MAQGPPNDAHKSARTAVLALHAAIASRRQHPDTPEVWRTAQRRAAQALADAAAAAPAGAALTLGLHTGAVHVDDEAVLPFQPDERPFGWLRTAGIGELRLERGADVGAADALVEHLSRIADGDAPSDPDAELAALLDTAHVPGVTLCAAADIGRPGLGAGAADLSALPGPVRTTPRLRALVERDAACNLPALAVRQLLDDAEGGDEYASPEQTLDVLQRLMERLLAADDVGTVTWLLTEVERQPTLPAGARARLVDMARRRCTSAHLTGLLDRGTPEELLQLSALVLQLGDDVAEEFAAAAAAVAHPLSQWLGELLGHSPDPADA